MRRCFLMLALLTTPAWGQLLVPLDPSKAPKNNQTSIEPWMKELQLTPDMGPKPVMLVSPPNLPKKTTVRRTKKITPKQTPPKKEGGILSTIPLIKELPKLLDGTQEEVTSRLTGLADNVDSFFAEKRADDELNRSRIRLNYSYTLFAEKKPIDDYAVRVNIRFPKLEQKVKDYFLGPESENNKKDPAVQAARRKKEKNPWILRTDAGMNLSYPPIFFTRARLRKNWELPLFIQRFTAELAWVSDQGVIQTTTLFHDYDVSDSLLFRFVNEQDWFLVPKEFTTAHGPSLIHKLTEDDGISYSFRAKSVVDGPWYLTGYGLGVRYRRNLHNQWLYGEIGPALDFPKTEGFRRTPSILLRIETLFGER